MTGEPHAEPSLGAVLKLERDGAAFFRRANAIAADPRVRQQFERLSRQREESAKLLEAAAARSGVKATPAPGPNPYPFEAIAKVECYSCGYVTEEIPTSCPQCGSARYAFEREFTKAMIWGTALASGKAVAAGVQAAIPQTKGELKAALETLLERERALLKEAEGELASAKA
ncbi:MAG TPA: hypothetical protein VK723_02540 [Thermoplasmata archaeon]|nr:hypothetical protein [Thermoplasmata archaeon]